MMYHADIYIYPAFANMELYPSQSQLTTSLITPATRKWVLGVKRYCAMSATCALPRETVRFHTLHLQPVNRDQWRQQPLNSHALWLMTSERNAHPWTSLKWLKVTISTQKRSHISQKGLYLKKSTWNKTLTYLKVIFPVNFVNSEFCSYTMLNTFASQKSWEWSLLTTLITNFQVKATFTPHMDT